MLGIRRLSALSAVTVEAKIWRGKALLRLRLVI